MYNRNNDDRLTDKQAMQVARGLFNRSRDCDRGDLLVGANQFCNVIEVISRVGPDSLRVTRVIEYLPNGEPVLFSANLN